MLVCLKRFAQLKGVPKDSIYLLAKRGEIGIVMQIGAIYLIDSDTPLPQRYLDSVKAGKGRYGKKGKPKKEDWGGEG